MKRTRTRKRSTLTAATADKFVLYQRAVQSAEAEVTFMDRVYLRHRGRLPRLFREDFCGTQLISCEWVKARPDNVAYGVDLHRPTLAWGLRNNLARLPADARRRVHQINDCVQTVRRPRVDVIGAFNYSFFIFKERRDLLAYFRAVRASLRPQGLFVSDAYGGHEAQQIIQDERKCRSFVYVWDQAAYNPINDHTTCHIHFKFPDGSVMRKAFTYDWRLWTLGGIQDAMLDAGFRRTEVYWEGTNSRGGGDGIFRLQKRAENCAGWSVYIVAIP